MEFMAKEKSSAKSKSKTPKRSRLRRSNKNMNVYSSLVYKSRAKADKRARKQAEDMASLPKEPVKRFFAHLHPKRVFKYWFSRRGLKTLFKVFAATVLLIIIAIGGLFLYFKKDLDAIKLDEMRVSETVNTYYDRNGELLWEDRGDGDYRLVVEGDQISDYMRKATVAIEDRNFYNHPGVDFGGIIRAAWSTLTGQGVQGGSTLTQQLIKQVYFSDEAKDRGITGIPRKIKELILALEVEKMYSKEQLITMYLNESPYGGRRNGVESAAQTYFGKSAKELTLAESALLAAIPNNPGVFNPYNEAGHDSLIWRQQYTLDVMVEMGYITKEEAEEAKKAPVLDQILPEADQYKDIKAPHFVLEVKDLLEEKYGVKTMRSGGFTIKTSLDYRAQQMAESAVAAGTTLMYTNGSDNISLSSVDVETGQVIAMVGSADWNTPVYGQVNATTSPLEPGSSIKPILDYGPLFMERDGTNYGPGSILRDENIDSIYCAGYTGACALRNSSGAFYGNLTIRQSLGNSLNIGAVKALYINGIESSLDIAHKLGDTTYCADNETAGLSMAIGSGCNVKAIEHANAYASIARGGVYKPLTYVLEMKNSSGEVVEQWTDSEGERVYDEQVAYMLESILSDASARTITFGSQASSFGFVVPGVWTGSKTGTTTTANSSVAKDSWMASFSPVIATVVWNGNHDGRGLTSSSNTVVRRVVNDYMGPVHTELYASENKWYSGMQPTEPGGMQKLAINGRVDIWPSWYNARQTYGATQSTMVFNKINKKLAAECTPEELKVQVTVTKTVDPLTKREILSVPDGYKKDETDDCSYTKPSASVRKGSDGKSVVVTIVAGSETLGNLEVSIDGSIVKSGQAVAGNVTVPYDKLKSGSVVKVVVTDTAGVTVTTETTF